jgi:hypothetical protein
MYYFGKIGGGDVKLFAGIALLNPYNNFNFLVSMAFFATMSSMLFYSIFYTIKYAKKGIIINENLNGIKQALIMGLILVIYVSFLLSFGLVGGLFS